METPRAARLFHALPVGISNRSNGKQYIGISYSCQTDGLSDRPGWSTDTPACSHAAAVAKICRRNRHSGRFCPVYPQEQTAGDNSLIQPNSMMTKRAPPLCHHPGTLTSFSFGCTLNAVGFSTNVEPPESPLSDQRQRKKNL